jgi:hypothetical protein
VQRVTTCRQKGDLFSQGRHKRDTIYNIALQLNRLKENEQFYNKNAVMYIFLKKKMFHS